MPDSNGKSSPAGGGLQARIAQSLADREAAYRLRYEIYVAEQGKPYAEADHDRRFLSDELDTDGTTIVVESSGQIVGTVRANWFDCPATASKYHNFFAIEQFPTIPPARIAVCSRLAALLEHRYQAARGLLFDSIYLRGLDRDTQLCFVACARILTRMFRGYGFREYAPPVNDPVVGPLHRFVLVLDDVEYLEQSGSPFYALAIEQKLPSVERPWLQSLLGTGSSPGQNAPQQDLARG